MPRALSSKPKIRKSSKPTITPETAVFLLDAAGAYVGCKENNKVKMLGKISPDDLLGSLNTACSVATPILPKDCIYFERIGGVQSTEIYVLQSSPQIITIDMVKDCLTPGKHQIMLPYIQFYCALINKKDKTVVHDINMLTCSNKPIKDLGDPVFNLPMPNLHSDGCVCWGNDNAIPKIDDCFKCDLPQIVRDHYFESRYNTDLTRHLTGIGNIAKWAEETKKNPNFIFNYKFHLGHKTFNNAIKYFTDRTVKDDYGD